MYHLLFTAAMAAIAAILLSKFWSRIREEVTDWLHRNGLQKSALMDVWVRLDHYASGILFRLEGKTRNGPIKISERIYSIDEIDAPDVRAALERQQHYQRSILSLIQ